MNLETNDDINEKELQNYVENSIKKHLGKEKNLLANQKLWIP